MSRDELHRQLTIALEELFDTPPEAVTEQASLYEDLDIDSIDTMDLLLRLKQIRGGNINQEQFRDVRTIGDILNILEQMDSP